jgi:hypothetical protein
MTDACMGEGSFHVEAQSGFISRRNGSKKTTGIFRK